MSNVHVSTGFVKEIQEEIDRINNTPLEEINWYDKEGQPIAVSEGLIEYWKFTGLSNWHFAQIELMGK